MRGWFHASDHFRARAFQQCGGNGTVIDSNQPELAVGTPAGYYHIPLGFTAACKVDLDADAEEGSIILFGDTTQQIPLPAITCGIFPTMFSFKVTFPSGSLALAHEIS